MAKGVNLDAGTEALIYHGATLRELARLFKMQPDTVKRRIGNLPPVGERNGFDIFSVSTAAPYLVPLPPDVFARVLATNHTDLPPSISKEFWLGQRSRIKYLEETGELWPTEDVISYFAEAFKEIRETIVLMGDSVARETTFSDRQRTALQQIIDTTLGTIRARLVDTFSRIKGGAKPADGVVAGGRRAKTIEEEAESL